MPTKSRQRPLRTPLRAELGATAVEYAMLIALIAFVIMGAVSVLGDRVGTALGGVSNGLTGTTQSSGDGGGGSGENGWGDGVGGGQDHNG